MAHPLHRVKSSRHATMYIIKQQCLWYCNYSRWIRLSHQQLSQYGPELTIGPTTPVAPTTSPPLSTIKLLPRPLSTIYGWSHYGFARCTAWWQKTSYTCMSFCMSFCLVWYEFFCHQAVFQEVKYNSTCLILLLFGILCSIVGAPIMLFSCNNVLERPLSIP